MKNVFLILFTLTLFSSQYAFSQQNDLGNTSSARTVDGLLRKIDITKINSVKIVSEFFVEDMPYIAMSSAVIEIDATIFARHIKPEDKLILTKNYTESDKDTGPFGSDSYSTYSIAVNSIDSDEIKMSSGTEANADYYNPNDYKRVKFNIKLDFAGGSADDNSKTYELILEQEGQTSRIVATVTKDIGWKISLDGKQIK